MTVTQMDGMQMKLMLLTRKRYTISQPNDVRQRFRCGIAREYNRFTLCDIRVGWTIF
jgi:hypothetical protein